MFSRSVQNKHEPKNLDFHIFYPFVTTSPKLLGTIPLGSSVRVGVTYLCCIKSVRRRRILEATTGVGDLCFSHRTGLKLHHAIYREAYLQQKSCEFFHVTIEYGVHSLRDGLRPEVNLLTLTASVLYTRIKTEGENRGKEGTTPVTTACPEAGKQKCETKKRNIVHRPYSIMIVRVGQGLSLLGR